MSEFEPGGGAEYAYENSAQEKVSYVLEGEMTVADKNGNEYVIHAGESISFPPLSSHWMSCNNTSICF